jgi:carboxymethylenebutenolidase
MPERVPPFCLAQIGTNAVRFPSGVPIPSMSDASVDPYAKSRLPKEVQVEGLLFWPQEKGPYPGLIVLHEWWGLTVQIKDLANRLACEGYTVLVPNLYARQGGMVTANTEVAAALMARVNETDQLQDLVSCCEYLNTRDHVKRNVHGVVGFGTGASLAIRFACHRKLLRSAVAFYGQIVPPLSFLKELYCPLLYHHAGGDASVSAELVEQLQQAGKEYGKRIEIKHYEGAPHAFCNDMRPDVYRPQAAAAAWDNTVEFLDDCFKAYR